MNQNRFHNPSHNPSIKTGVFIMLFCLAFTTKVAQAQVAGGESIVTPSISAPTLPKPSGITSGSGIQSDIISPTTVIAPPRFTRGSFGVVGGGSAIEVQKIDAPRLSVPAIAPRHSISTSTGAFDYNRYNRFGHHAPVANPVAVKKSIYPEADEHVDSVQILLPSLDGYEIIEGNQFAPDISQNEFIWLPIGSR